MRFDKRWIIGKRVTSVDLSRQEGHSPGYFDTVIDRIIFDDGSVLWFTVGEQHGAGEYNVKPGYSAASKRKAREGGK